MLLLSLVGTNPNVQFDARRFTWRGSPSNEQDGAYMLWACKDAQAKSLAEARVPGSTSLLLGGIADGSADTDIALLMKRTAGLNVKIISDYPDSNAINIAIDRGELEGRFIGLFAVASTRPGWLQPGSVTQSHLLFARATRHPRYPDVPTSRGLARDERGRQLIKLAETPYLLSRPDVGPPDMPPDRAKALQSAFADVFKDQEFVADAAKLQVDISSVGPQEALRMLDRVAKAPADLKDELRALQSSAR